MTRVYGPNELVEDVQKKGLCIGCGACVELCPYFKNHRGQTAMLFPCTLPQGRCNAFCPKTEVDLDELAARFWGTPYEGDPLGKRKAVLKSRRGSKAGKGDFQAGGTASALIDFALQTGLIDAAALTGREGLVPRPLLAKSSGDVLKAASSKYTAAPTLAALNRGMREGCTRLGIVGTPCQMTAVAQMRSNPLGREDFEDRVALTVGLFCTWALDTRKLIPFLSQRMDVTGIRKMDIPPPPAEIFVLETDKGRIEIPLSEIRPLVPEGCRICTDMTSEWADVAVGVMEGDPGWNSLIVRTEKGARLVEEARAAGVLEIVDFPAESLDHLTWAAANKKRRALSRAKELGVLNVEEGRAAIRLRAEVVEQVISREMEGPCHG